MNSTTVITPVPPMLRYSILASLCYLLLDGFVGGLLDHESFTHALLSTHDLQEWWMRFITIAIIITFALFSQKAFERQQNLMYALDLSKKELRLLIESASEGILFLDNNEKALIANPSICQITGYTEEQLQRGDLHRLINPHLPDGTALDTDHCPLCHLDPTIHDTTHIPHLLLTSAHNNTISVECWVRPVRNNEGQFEGWLTTMIDIDKRVHAEQQSQQLLEELQTEQQHLKERNDELQRFAYVASHDLQEPLRMVSSFIQLLHRRYSDQLDDSAKEFIGFAVDGTNRMQQMINDLLNYSRIGSQSKPL
ncbi:MAG: histidine kinase dimerization/phospho-acceptor domain-containing protein, partial [Mariprofundales bacterium]